MPLNRLLFVCMCLFFCETYSQNIEASLHFDTDTFSIGKICKATLTISHPDTTSIIFPQKKEAFTPFEWVSQEVVPSKTKGNTVKDVVIYRLQSFDISPKQALTLRYRYMQGGDTITEYISSDSLKLQYRIAQNDSLKSLTFKGYEELIAIDEPPNTLLIAFLSIAILAILVIIFVSVRKPITSYFRRQLILREWGNIRRQLAKLRSQKIPQSTYLDELNKIWKDVFAKENYISLRSLTTPELIPFIEEQTNLSEEQKALLIHTARTSDKVIYANIPVETAEIEQISAGIHGVLEALFQQKLKV